VPERITRAEVEHVARLARLELTADEVEQMTQQLGVILDYADELSRLDLEGVEPTSHPLALVNVLRADEPVPSLDRATVLAEAPSVEDDRFRVPRIIDAP